MTQGTAEPVVVVTTEARLTGLPDGSLWTQGTETRDFFERYRTVFPRVEVLARVEDRSEALPNSVRVDGQGVCVIRLDELKGVGGAASLTLRALRGRYPFNRAGFRQRTVILRAPGTVSWATWLACRRMAVEDGVELVSDPEESLSDRAMGNRWASMVRPVATGLVRRILADATAAAYVTERKLQRKYPIRSGTMHSYSSVEVPSALLHRGMEHAATFGSRPARKLVFVGRLDRPLKGFDVMLEAMATIGRAHPDATLVAVGDGALLPVYRGMARDMGIDHQVSFLGWLPSGWPIFMVLLASDLFVLPSRREGLPRALIEAMAAGLPCIATRVGGATNCWQGHSSCDLTAPGS